MSFPGFDSDAGISFSGDAVGEDPESSEPPSPPPSENFPVSADFFAFFSSFLARFFSFFGFLLGFFLGLELLHLTANLSHLHRVLFDVSQGLHLLLFHHEHWVVVEARPLLIHGLGSVVHKQRARGLLALQQLDCGLLLSLLLVLLPKQVVVCQHGLRLSQRPAVHELQPILPLDMTRCSSNPKNFLLLAFFCDLFLKLFNLGFLCFCLGLSTPHLLDLLHPSCMP
mmetsp:Transcript_40567/g.75952  ORF Transcript_40567/g.75952 Transcript_40567/m.75952 type:complete len:226 (+) Transcript_40567:1108-1785(+)